MTLRDYWHVVWLRKWVVVGVVVVCTAVAFVLSYTQTRMYQATAKMMYVQPTNPNNPNSVSAIDQNTLGIQLQGVVNTVANPDVKQRALELLPADRLPEGTTVTATVTTPENSTIADLVAVTAKTTSAEAAANIANGYAEAMIALRKEATQARLRAAQKVIEGQMALYTTAASRLTSDYLALSQQLRNLQIAEATAGDLTVVVPAMAPSGPVSPKPLRSAAIGFGVGLFAGVALAFLVGQFDTRVRSHREVAEIFSLPVLGRVPHVSRRVLRGAPLAAAADPEGKMSESLRMLRSNLEWAGIDDRLCTLLVTSCTKGEGKTVTVSNLAITFARAGKRVLLVDADLRDPMVHRVFDLPNAVGLSSVIMGSATLEDATHLYRLPKVAGPTIATPQGSTELAPGAAWEGTLRVLTSGPLPPSPGEVVASRRLSSWLTEVCISDLDYVFVDSPPLLSVGDAAALAPSVDGVLLIANVEIAQRPNLVDGREILDSLPCRKLGVVVVGEDLERAEYYHYRRNGSRR